MNKSPTIIPISTIEKKILVTRDEKVIFDSDLAELYGVTTANLNKAIKRNLERFPKDFMFQLNKEETRSLRFQIGTSSSRHGGRRYLPYVFTEHGALMAANVLKSKRAKQVSIQIIRTFILMRQALAENKNLSKRIDELEKKYDSHFRAIFDAIRALMNPPEPKRKPIGFRVK